MSTPSRTLALALLALWPALAPAAERWRLQYFYDPAEDSEFTIADLAFPSERVGIAAGQIVGQGKPKPYAVSTTDGGRTWVPLPVPDIAISLFFVDRHTGWLVASKSMWRTGDFGRNWTRLKPLADVLRVYFLDPKQGWAIGANKSVFETADGGDTWTPVAAAATPETARAHSVYSAIAFASPKDGMIVGWSKPPRPGERGRDPDWVDPEAQPPEWPGLAMSLQTKDAGRTWKASETSMFGQSTALSLAADGRGLLLIEFFGRFDYPSEVYSMDLATGKTTRAFRRRDRAVTDVLVTAKGPAYLAAIEPPGTLFHSPVPGKLKILKSDDLVNWTEMSVDYRAVARRTNLASPDGENVWVATDTGMILKLSAE